MKFGGPGNPGFEGSTDFTNFKKSNLRTVLNAEEECGDSRVWYKYFPVATRDVLSYAPVSPESFPVESTRVLILGSTV